MADEFTAFGVVLGNLWGGGKGWYPARKYHNGNLPKMKAEIMKDFKSGALDSGMGYEKLTGAMMLITKTETKNVKGKAWKNVEDLPEWFLGKMSDSEQEEAVNVINQF